MSVLEALITADRVVLAGLSAYDQAMARAWATASAEMEKAGVPADQIQAAKEAHDERTLSGRGRLHREVWTKALALVAAGQPGSGETAAPPSRVIGGEFE